MSRLSYSLIAGCLVCIISPIPAQAIDVGASVPQCLLMSPDGKQSKRLADFKGKVTYVDFWASWCPPCLQSFPFMNSLQHDLKARGLQVVGVNVDEETQDAQAFLARQPVSFAVAVDSAKSCVQAFGVQAMPSTYLIDGKGIVRHVHQGFRAGESIELRKKVESLLAESSGAASQTASHSGHMH